MDAVAAGDFLDLFDKIRAAVIDCMVRTQRFGCRAFVIRTASNNNRQSKQFAQLDRHRANAAGAAMDQDSFAITRIGPLKHIVPHGE